MTDGPHAGATPEAGIPASGPQPGWYPDPWAGGYHRYWDGQTWTGHAFPDGLGPTTGGPRWTAPSAALSQPSQLPPPPAWTPPDDGPTWAPLIEPSRPEAVPAGAGLRLPQGRAFLALLLVVGLVVGFLGVVGGFYAAGGRSKSKVPSAAATRPQQPAPSTLPPAPADPSALVLAGLVVTQADVPATLTVRPISGGHQVAGQVTLDLCNGTFPSESLRTGRLQVAAFDALGDSVLSTEAVLYSTPAATAQAFSELKTTPAKCPSTPVVSPVGDRTVTTHFNAAPDANWPQTSGVDRLAFDFTSTDESGQARHAIAVYLRRGRVLMGVYFSQPDGPQSAVAGHDTIAGIAGVFATRMAQLPASVVKGG